MLKSYDVTENLIEFEFEEGDIEDGFLLLTPKDVHETIKKMKDSLFAWSKKTGKRVDNPACQ